ncbi:hypothetical protein Syun_023914 [Stephania yunnanensis]|uniref:Uncharacterized protein n=1 Tax=Stephania yunnanensis TaxID=152371 RepID=A0AAP0FPE0_9MAGN
MQNTPTSRTSINPLVVIVFESPLVDGESPLVLFSHDEILIHTQVRVTVKPWMLMVSMQRLSCETLQQALIGGWKDWWNYAETLYFAYIDQQLPQQDTHKGAISYITQVAIGNQHAKPKQKLLLSICSGVALATCVVGGVLFIFCIIQWKKNSGRRGLINNCMMILGFASAFMNIVVPAFAFAKEHQHVLKGLAQIQTFVYLLQPAGWKLKKEFLPDGWLCLENQDLPPNFIRLAKDVYTPDMIAASDCMIGI